MRVLISYTTEVSDDFRRSINQYHGEPGMATREDVRRWFYLHGQSMNENLAMQEDERQLVNEGNR